MGDVQYSTDLSAIRVSGGTATFNGSSTGAGSISVSGGMAIFNCSASPLNLTLSGGTLGGSGTTIIQKGAVSLVQ